MAEGAAEISEDTLLAGRVRLRQPRRGHRIGTDAVLLAATVSARDGDVVYDLGAGAGGVGLIVAARSLASLVFVERDPALAELCRQNLALNGLAERARVVEADILAPARERRQAGLSPASADVVVTNPPFLEEMRSRRSPVEGRAAAHHIAEGGLEGWIRTCADLLNTKGRLFLIHRADRLGDCLAHLGPAFGAIAVRNVHPRADEPAIRVLLGATKGSRQPMRLLPALVLHDAEGRFTPEAEAIHSGEGLLADNKKRAPRGARS
jgi:tRNA1(Val) A37 N6-methylase TrmN6